MTTHAEELVLGIPGFTYEDLFDAAKLAELAAAFDRDFAEASPDAFARFDAYRRVRGEGMTPEAKSAALLDAAPHVSAFVGRLGGGASRRPARGHEAPRAAWRFKQEFVKKRVRAGAGKAGRTPVTTTLAPTRSSPC